MIKRFLQQRIDACFFKNKAIIIYGAQQVGKTTLIKEIQKKYLNDSLFLNCDEPDIRDSLTEVTSTELKNLIGRKTVVFIDEAQRVKNIGLTIKLLVDNFPDVQIVATGSSSLDLSNEIIEPLTGRKYEFHLFPFSLVELQQKYSFYYIAERMLEIIESDDLEECRGDYQEEVRKLLYWMKADKFPRRNINQRLKQYAMNDEEWRSYMEEFLT